MTVEILINISIYYIIIRHNLDIKNRKQISGRKFKEIKQYIVFFSFRFNSIQW